MEYDLVLNKEDAEIISSSIGKFDIIQLSCRHPFKRLTKQTKCKVGCKNGIIDAIDKYNQFFKTDHKFENLLKENPFMCSQQSFICKNEVFVRLNPNTSF